MKTCLLLLTLFLALQAHAVSCGAIVQRYLQDSFKRSFHDESIYECDMCHANIYRFLQRLQQKAPSLELSNIRVLFMVGQHTQDLIPDYQFRNVFYTFQQRDPERLGNYNQWLYHVILEAEGKVYDFDYSQNAAVADTQEYFRDFIGDQVNIFSIPAEVYLESIYPKIVAKQFDRIKATRYLMSYRQFMQSL